MHRLQLQTGAFVGKLQTHFNNANALLYDGERLYVSNDSMVAAVDKGGNVLWRRSVKSNSAWGLGGLGVIGKLVQPDYSRD